MDYFTALVFVVASSSRILCHTIIGRRQATAEKDRQSRAASAISRRIFLPWPLNVRFNLHLYCINSKERRLRDKGEEGIDGGWSTIKAIKNSNERSDTSRSLSPCASNFLNYIAENERSLRRRRLPFLSYGIVSFSFCIWKNKSVDILLQWFEIQ